MRAFLTRRSVLPDASSDRSFPASPNLCCGTDAQDCLKMVVKQSEGCNQEETAQKVLVSVLFSSQRVAFEFSTCHNLQLESAASVEWFALFTPTCMSCIPHTHTLSPSTQRRSFSLPHGLGKGFSLRLPREWAWMIDRRLKALPKPR